MTASRRTLFLPLLCLGLSPLPLLAASQVFQIGSFDGQNGDFEQENNLYNTPLYYAHPGDYTTLQGNYGFGENFAGPGAEILQDGPNGTVDPGDPGSAHNWSISLEGFPRALTGGRPVLDVFFQLNASGAASTALLLEADLFGLGANSFHDLTFYLNNVPFYRQLGIRGNTPLKLYIPKNQPGIVFHEGANVLSVRRTGGGLVDPAGVNNQWIQFDALRLTAEVTSPVELIWQIGYFDNNTAEFEQELNSNNNPQYYTGAGDYSGVAGKAGKGSVYAGPDAEIWKDAGGNPAESTEGFPRAMVPGRPAVDIFFQLTPAQAQQNWLSFKTVLFALGGNSTHDVRFYLNGTPVGQAPNVTGNTQVELLIPRQGVAGPGMGPVFLNGNNVLSIVRTAGGPVDPLGGNNPWIQFDALTLSTAIAPADPALAATAWRTLFSVGYYNATASEFEQESGAYNNPAFYTAPGDYSATPGMAGLGQVWDGPEPEVWQDGPLSTDWDDTPDGFPRAVIKSDWGRPTIDLFFQADAAAAAGTAIFNTKLFGLGAASSHDLEFYLNGEAFFTQTGITADTWITAPLPAGKMLTGSNVLSMVRTGGLNTDTAWIQFDQVELVSQAAASLPAFAVTEIVRNAGGQVVLTWESVAGAKYDIMAAPALDVARSPVVLGLDGNAGTTSYTDADIPANTPRRFYWILRTR